MSHSAAVLACAFASDSELLATGSQDGKVKVWRISDGVCVRKFPHAHSEGVTALCFSKDSTQLASGSFDHIVRCVRACTCAGCADRPAVRNVAASLAPASMGCAAARC